MTTKRTACVINARKLLDSLDRRVRYDDLPKEVLEEVVFELTNLLRIEVDNYAERGGWLDVIEDALEDG